MKATKTIVTTETVTAVTLTMTHEEALMLYSLVASIGGSGAMREIINQVEQALRKELESGCADRLRVH